MFTLLIKMCRQIDAKSAWGGGAGVPKSPPIRCQTNQESVSSVNHDVSACFLIEHHSNLKAGCCPWWWRHCLHWIQCKRQLDAVHGAEKASQDKACKLYSVDIYIYIYWNKCNYICMRFILDVHNSPKNISLNCSMLYWPVFSRSLANLQILTWS